MIQRRILLDQMMDERVASALRDCGHNVVRVGAIGLATVGDDEILARAMSDNRILVTLDEHFGDWVVLPLSRHSGVVRLKAIPATTDVVLGLLLPFLKAHESAVFDDRLVIVKKNGVRWIRTAE
ncbi:MAG: DUF5615 family PIN-like protein [Lentisphaerae bacterium]|nr:DUF5615 family PIN-like protein [Lentisphaerota bacterium]